MQFNGLNIKIKIQQENYIFTLHDIGDSAHLIMILFNYFLTDVSLILSDFLRILKLINVCIFNFR